MTDKYKTKKELMIELEELQLQLKHFERSGENGTDIPDETFRLIVESVPNGIVITDNMGQIIFLNSQAEKMFGYERGALFDKSVEELIPEGFRHGHIKFRSEYMKEPDTRPMGEGRDLFALRSDGSQFPVEIGLNFVRSDSGLVVISTIIDITERKNTEKLLNEREQRLREIMDNTTDAIIVFDNEGVVETLNREAQQLFCGNSKEKIDQIWEIITPENKENFSEMLNKVKEGKRITDYETERIGKDGKRISVSISLVYMSEGNGRFIETIRDISERLVMRNKIIELEKAQIIGKMAEGFAHHMGTPLASMLLRVQMLKDDILDLPEYEDVGEKLNSIERQILYGQISCKDETTQSVNVKIKDTGIGISKETIPFVFEPFFTTKPAGKGTGLGLSVAKGIVHDHGGDINIKSKQGSGTIVSISFPILNEEKIS
jgi:PAS domain S-box-containing protein